MSRLSTLIVLCAAAPAAAHEYSFRPPAAAVERYDVVECTVLDAAPNPKSNPFSDRPVTATFTRRDGQPVWLRGFCDSADGKTFRVRFMPAAAGEYTYEVRVHHGGDTLSWSGKFVVTEGKRKGPVRIDPKHPHHFVWEGTGEHYFWNGTTTYWLLGVQDDKQIAAAIDRLAALKVNRIRVALNARTKDGGRWFEPQVTNTDAFKFRVNPWPAKNPDSPTDPQLDTSRFDIPLWQKMDKLVRHAREKDVAVSVIFHLDGADKGVDPFGGGDKKWPGSEAEWNYYRYAAARLSAFSNVMWDLTNEWHLFRNVDWTNKAGDVLREADPVKHLTSVHGRGDFPFYRSPWADFALYQVWDEHGGYKFLRKARDLAAKAGRPMPQVNEEYGYEDHYPGPWGGGRKAPARSADNRRRLAWEMTMAGGYQTTGERANEPGTGGWVTGLGNDRMTMLTGYSHMVDFFTSFDWWKCDPADGLATGGALVLAEPGKRYVVYLPKGGSTALKAGPGEWAVKWFNPRTGEWRPAGTRDKDVLSFDAPDGEDWAVLVTK